MSIGTSVATGYYTGCSLHLMDHAGLVSSGIDFGDFYFFSDKTQLCNHPDFQTSDHVPQSECEALVALYTGTNGDAWTNT